MSSSESSCAMGGIANDLNMIRCQFDTKKPCLQLKYVGRLKSQSQCHSLLIRQKYFNFRYNHYSQNNTKVYLKPYFLILFALILTVKSHSAFAQKKKLKSAGVVQLNDSIASYSQSDIFRFPNVNKVRFYYD